MARIIVNASNLHVGGGVQVAVSFLHELSLISHGDYVIWASSEVDGGLRSIDASIVNSKYYSVVNTYGLGAFFSPLNKYINKNAIIFTVFGPNYFRKKAGVDIVGFAQPWIIYDSGYGLLNLYQSVKNKFKFFFQKLWFKRSDYLVVELEHVKNALVEKKIFSENSIFVVNNSVSKLYFDTGLWKDFDFDIQPGVPSVGFLGRDYVHKNTNILPLVKEILLKKYNLKINFYVTLNDDEWIFKSEQFKSNINNVGALTVAQCPSFYRRMDAIIFPSLLECFSATPLEAMVMKKPLFASDRGFVRDVCGNYAHYFDPTNPESIADCIAEYFMCDKDNKELVLENARSHVLCLPSARDRALRYMEILVDCKNKYSV